MTLGDTMYLAIPNLAPNLAPKPYCWLALGVVAEAGACDGKDDTDGTGAPLPAVSEP